MTRNSAENSAWIRLGARIREARKALGYSSFEAFAEACGFSARVASAIEAGERTNYSVPTLERLETGLGWSSGTVQRVLSEPDFDPATTTAQRGGGMLFRPPDYGPNTVPVAVDSVIEVCEVLDQAAASASAGAGELRQLAATVLPVCWLYILPIIQNNCVPVEYVHPAGRLIYDGWVKVREEFSSPDDLSSYAQWLVGDRPDTGKADRDRYRRRWEASVQHALSEGETPISVGGGLFRPLRRDDSPVMVDRDMIVRVIEVLCAIAEAHGLGKSTTDAEADRRDDRVLWLLAAASLRVCWPYITRLVEDNVTPGVEVNPAVDQQYTVFRDMQMFFAPDDRTGMYTQWLTGKLDDVDDKTRQRYLQRWHESRHKRMAAKRAPRH